MRGAVRAGAAAGGASRLTAGGARHVSAAAGGASAGNDVVCFSLTDPERSVMPQFYGKILAPTEHLLFDALNNDLSFHQFLWLCWSIKESVYKFARRTRAGLVFAPTKIVVTSVTPGDTVLGRVRAFDATFYTRSRVSPEGVFTVAHHLEDFTGMYQGWGQVDEATQSEGVRTLLLQEIGALAPGFSWSVDKHSEGYPTLLRDGQPIDVPLSFAHHGPFVGYSFYMPAEA
jgi:phosphopantetheinyl transferase (holo-ACP synthase)